jgi:excisionase family DNA binding protein
LAHFVAVGSAEDTIISLSRASEDSHREVRIAAVETLHAFAAAAPMAVARVLRQVIGKPGVQDADLVASAIESLRPCGPDAASDAVAELEALLKDRRVASAIRITVCGLLGWLGANAAQAANTLAGIVFGDVENRPDPRLRIAAAKALLSVADLVAVLSARPVAADRRHEVLSLLREVGTDATTARQALERLWQSGQSPGTLPSADTPVADATASAERLAGIESRLTELKKLVKAQQVTQAEKALYTVAEAAEQTGYSKFTLRQACNKGRIRAEKGPDGQWRIPRDEITKIENEGLPKE